MAFSLHSHSGQFCPGHAKDELEECIQAAIAKGFQVFGLTEHMPRNSPKDLYPEEVIANESIAKLTLRHDAFLKEAMRLREKYHGTIVLLIGFEGEWIRPSYGPLILDLARAPEIDYFIGSVHHVHEIPIDYDEILYSRARTVSGGSDERLFEDYFDAQLDMLRTVRPPIVGHFDLIRLWSERRNTDLREFKGVWQRVVRNLTFIVELGALLEINSSGLRKGLHEPYPMRCVCEEFLGMGGRLTMGDDSHGTVQVGTHYPAAISYIESLMVKEVWCLNKKVGEKEGHLMTVRGVSLQLVKASLKV
ncbi:hypothetical protein BGHDH14_bgh00138 [Blumeria hordei DH14]|uniref:Histidinol-phosphatase n=1 Tax=Blumeria graminis f. sp. hordei (strain DH14) TaxID=546991 RepID=N1JGZ0_BLUG1|nr:hypothetical protein BGHDH14_bgh00138 [Blumeria hordei DH14]